MGGEVGIGTKLLITKKRLVEHEREHKIEADTKFDLYLEKFK